VAKSKKIFTFVLKHLSINSIHIFLFLLITILIACTDSPELNENLTDAINHYRMENGLSEIPVSQSLTIVAETHVEDLYFNHPDTGLCNTHSWSDKGNWTAGCYIGDIEHAEIMWGKPMELTSYTGYGYEITAFSTNNNLTVEQVLKKWQDSDEHNDIILNRGKWNGIEWKAIGSAIFKNYAVVWFGKEVDNN